MKISLLVAMATNRVIGKDNALPWYLPEDLKFFKRVTLHKPVVMGRKTYESIGKPLPQRVNIVITRNQDYRPHGVTVVHSLDAALAVSQELLAGQGEADGEVMVIGGAEIFDQSMAQADRIYLTEVHADIEGDTWFPEIDRKVWEEKDREDKPAGDKNEYPYSFVVLERNR